MSNNLVVLIFIIILVGIFVLNDNPKNKGVANEILSNESVTQASKPTDENNTLKVPFVVQAPYAVWDAFHQETCEEASLLMIKYYFDGKSSVSQSEIEQDFHKMIDYESSVGMGVSINLDQLNNLAKNYLNLHTGKIIKDFSAEDIINELSDGNPVIVPVAGKMLKNPNYRNGGAIYHMLVIIGFTHDNFIVNDSGTKQGSNYEYKKELLLNAIHDWNEQEIMDGPKSALVFGKL